MSSIPSQKPLSWPVDIEGVSDWVLSGSICCWGDALLNRFTLAVFLYVQPGERLARLMDRERRALWFPNRARRRYESASPRIHRVGPELRFGEGADSEFGSP